MRFRRARTANDYIRLFRLYKAAFPAYERKPIWVLLAKQNKKHGDIFLIEQGDHFIGLAITLKDEDVVMLDYFAIKEDQRGKGYGSQAIRHLQKLFCEKRFLLEIEEVDSEQGDKQQKKRRKQFYLRNGLKELKVHVKLFGVDMELLGTDRTIEFADYYGLYHQIYGDGFVAANVKERKI